MGISGWDVIPPEILDKICYPIHSQRPRPVHSERPHPLSQFTQNGWWNINHVKLCNSNYGVPSQCAEVTYSQLVGGETRMTYQWWNEDIANSGLCSTHCKSCGRYTDTSCYIALENRNRKWHSELHLINARRDCKIRATKTVYSEPIIGEVVCDTSKVCGVTHSMGGVTHSMGGVTHSMGGVAYKIGWYNMIQMIQYGRSHS